MIKFTKRRACLGGLALVLAVCSLLTLCFPVVRLSLEDALGGNGAINDLLEVYGISASSENGFALLDGNSKIWLFFKDFSVGFASGAEIEYRMTDLSGLEIFAQVFNILILIFSVLAVFLSVGWIFGMRSESIVTTIALITVWIGVVYLVEGLLFSLFFEAEWDKMLDMAAGNASVFFGNMFSTLAYVPFILIAVFEIAFWVLYYKTKDKEEENLSEEEESENLPADFAREKSFGAAEAKFEQLKALKDLYESKILTEEEFTEEKKKILNG